MYGNARERKIGLISLRAWMKITKYVHMSDWFIIRCEERIYSVDIHINTLHMNRDPVGVATTVYNFTLRTAVCWTSVRAMCVSTQYTPPLENNIFLSCCLAHRVHIHSNDRNSAEKCKNEKYDFVYMANGNVHVTTNY